MSNSAAIISRSNILPRFFSSALRSILRFLLKYEAIVEIH